MNKKALFSQYLKNLAGVALTGDAREESFYAALEHLLQQVAEKWLKDRRERSLSLEEVRTYCRILTALARTIETQVDIDDLYLAVQAKRATVEWA